MGYTVNIFVMIKAHLVIRFPQSHNTALENHDQTITTNSKASSCLEIIEDATVAKYKGSLKGNAVWTRHQNVGVKICFSQTRTIS